MLQFYLLLEVQKSLPTHDRLGDQLTNSSRLHMCIQVTFMPYYCLRFTRDGY